MLPINFPDAYDIEDVYSANILQLSDMREWNQRPSNLSQFEENGIQFAITTDGLKSPNNLKTNIKKAIDHGLSKSKALEALTSIPAKLIGRDDILGYLKKGYLANFLINEKFTIYSTGGTSKFLKKIGIPFKEISQYTKQKEILGGRVKTLHPKIFGGLLAEDSMIHQKELRENQMINFDLLVVNLYPFEETLNKTKDHKKIIEMIDIGGHSLIRSSVKNYKKTMTIVDPDDYFKFEKFFRNIERHHEIFAIKALEHANQYDQHIINWFKKENFNKMELFDLRYGENPHQKAHAKIQKNAFRQISGGKKLSYNNLLDLDAAINIAFNAPKTNEIFKK